MSEYCFSTTVESPRDTIFDVLMDPSNLPRFVACIEAAEPLGDDGVLIRGGGFAFGACVRIVDVLRRLEWNVGADWSGWVQVDGDDDAGVAQVRAEVRCVPRSKGRSAAMTRVDAQVGDVGEFLATSVLALKSLVEAMPRPAAGPARCQVRSGRVSQAGSPRRAACCTRTNNAATAATNRTSTSPDQTMPRG